MNAYECEGTRELSRADLDRDRTLILTERVEAVIHAESPGVAVERFALRFSFLPDYVDGEAVQPCEGCLDPILLDSSDYATDEEGSAFCRRCCDDAERSRRDELVDEPAGG